MSQEEEFIDPFHLGNTISINYKSGEKSVGTIIYRDDDKINLRPQNASDRATELKFDDKGDLDESYEIESVTVIDLVTMARFVEIFGITAGAHLEFFTLNGEKAAENGIVESVAVKKDRIVLTDGRQYKFRGIGPEPPIAVIRVSSQASNVEEQEQGQEQEQQEVQDDPAVQQYLKMMELLQAIEPASAIEAIRTSDLTYPDSIQRSDLIQDIIDFYKSDKSIKMTPHLIHRIEREVDVLFNLKEKMTNYDDSGNIIGIIKNVINSFGDAIAINSRIPAAIPIIAGSLVLNVDDNAEVAHNSDVTPRLIQDGEQQAVELNKLFDSDKISTAPGAAFATYMHRLLDKQTFVNNDAVTTIPVDQDVIRTAALENAVQGFAGKLPSGAQQKEGIIRVTVNLLASNVKNRMIRLLKSDEITINKSGDKIRIVPGDPGTVLSYMILPAKIALALRPQTRLNGNLQTLLNSVSQLESDNQPTVTDALFSLSSNDKGDPLQIWSITPEEAAGTELAEWLGKVIKYTIHKADSLAPRSAQILQLLDAVGLVSSELDLSAPINEIINNWVAGAQTEWIQLMESYRTSEIAPSVIEMPGHSNDLWALLRSDERFKELQTKIKEQNPLIAEMPSLQAAIFSSIYQGDYAPLVWNAVRTLSSFDQGGVQALLAAIQLSKLFNEKRSILSNLKLTALNAAPEINPCEHVLILEAIRNTASAIERSRLLNNFIEKYQGARKGEWLECSLCQKNAVCVHEIMELEMLAQPNRFDALQRQLFIRFGGDRYLGSIVCRNCGQALKEIDFDDNVEFDDNGKPIIQNAVVTEEQTENETAEEKLMTALREEFSQTLSFVTIGQRTLYDILIEIATATGVQLTPEIAKEIVFRADNFITIFADEGQYNRGRASAMKLKKTVIDEYSVYISKQRVIILLALLVIAIQTADPLLQVSASQLCKFSRGGYPLEDQPLPAVKDEINKYIMTTPSTIYYVACCMTFIKREYPPWEHLEWAKSDKLDQIRFNIYTTLRKFITELLTAPRFDSFQYKIEIKTQIDKMRSDIIAQRDRALLSKTDKLPLGFRPQPFPATANEQTHPEVARNANKRDGRIIELYQQKAEIEIVEFHRQATEANVPMPFNEFVTQIIPMNSELSSLLLQMQSNPPSFGTHLSPTFIPAKLAEVQSGNSVDGDSIFRIFLRFCDSGPKKGAPHEIDVGYKCRQCGFVLGPPKDINDFGSDRELIDYQKSLVKTEVNVQSFNNISNAVRKYGIIPQVIKARSSDSVFRKLATCEPHSFLERFVPGFLKAEAGGSVDEEDLAEIWSEISFYNEELKKNIATKLASIKIKSRPISSDVIGKLFGSFNSLLADPWVEGPSQIQEYWCSKVSTAATGAAITNVRGQIWSLLAHEHREDVDKLVEGNAKWSELSITEGMTSVLQRLSQSIAPYINVWKSHVRSVSSPILTTEYARLLLTTIVMNGWWEALDTSSYIEVEDSMKDTVSQQIAQLTIDLIIHSSKQTIRFSTEEIKRVLQERAAKERVTIVEEFEKLGDNESRATELLMKQFGIGRWGKGKNLTKYDKERYLSEKEQRGRMMVDSTVAGAAAAAPGTEFGVEFGEGEEMTAGGGEFEGEDN